MAPDELCTTRRPHVVKIWILLLSVSNTHLRRRARGSLTLAFWSSWTKPRTNRHLDWRFLIMRSFINNDNPRIVAYLSTTRFRWAFDFPKIRHAKPRPSTKWPLQTPRSHSLVDLKKKFAKLSIRRFEPRAVDICELLLFPLLIHCLCTLFLHKEVSRLGPWV